MTPPHQEFDQLIEKFQRGQLTNDEVTQFKHYLYGIIDDIRETHLRKKAARETLLLLHMQYEMDQSKLDIMRIFASEPRRADEDH